MTTIGIIGFGSIARDLIDILCAQDPPPEALVIMVRPEKTGETLAAAQEQVAGRCAVHVVSDTTGLFAARPDVIAECASHTAVAQFGPAILRAQIDIVVASIGALADPQTEAALKAAAEGGSAQLVLPAGAIGGIDMLAAARLSGLTGVTYTGRKPPRAWSGTPAEQAVDLPALTEATVFFEGSAREAATQYPKNANVAATLAIAGLGMDETRVRLVADPGVDTNTHEFSVQSQAVDFAVTLTAKASPRNPKTSASTAYSVARAVLNRSAGIVI
ncbi:aspartate dehydrogenase [Pararhodobacter marinus]|uniref:L-aspartate dehydrogenase n=1 Tax=Pararhodobacter marinus TaxID=2184063 RepID=A0A2U2CCQ2_9RHOB|nr:aspartate dehydrogenase [Pararhodobacter marinus]PWE29668.1 aspartate dehydrogenase [Pararhodobacter marinus]